METGSSEMKTSMTGLQVSPRGAVVDNANAGDRCVYERFSRMRRRLVCSEAVVGDAGSRLVLRSAQDVVESSCGRLREVSGLSEVVVRVASIVGVTCSIRSLGIRW